MSKDIKVVTVMISRSVGCLLHRHLQHRDVHPAPPAGHSSHRQLASVLIKDSLCFPPYCTFKLHSLYMGPDILHRIFPMGCDRCSPRNVQGRKKIMCHYIHHMRVLCIQWKKNPQKPKEHSVRNIEVWPTCHMIQLVTVTPLRWKHGWSSSVAP